MTAQGMRELRERRRGERLCRQCKLPAKINEKTGKPMAMCPDHLAEDKARVAKAARAARRAKRRG